MEKVVGCGAPARKKVGVWGPGRGRRWEIGGWPWPYVSVVRGIRRWGMGGWWCVGWGWERGEGLVVVGVFGSSCFVPHVWYLSGSKN